MPVFELSQRGLTFLEFCSRLGLSLLKMRYKLLEIIITSRGVYYIKAHLDGVGRGEWGAAHILAHKEGYTCGVCNMI